MKKLEKIYEKRIAYYEKKGQKHSRKIQHMSYIRLLMILILLGTFLATSKYSISIRLAVILVEFIGFIYLVNLHHKMKKHLKYLFCLKEEYKKSLQRLNGEWRSFKDTGKEFIDLEHPFSVDLDIFGVGSLFQWITSTHTVMGREKLAFMLTHPCKDYKKILKKQQAILELSKKRWFKHRFYAEGALIEEHSKDHEDLVSWGEKKNTFYTQTWFIALIIILPIVTLSTLVLGLMGRIPLFIGNILILIHLALKIIDGKKRNEELDILYVYKNKIKIYRNLLNRFVNIPFHSEYLCNLQRNLEKDTHSKVIDELKRLEKISEAVMNRKNLAFVPINILLFWDFWCMFYLQRWKNRSGSSLKVWLRTLGEVEAMCSLSNIESDDQTFTFPKVVKEPSILEVKSMAHPLLKDAVDNDVNFEKPTKVLLITGSNMSGKSTFLRTIGINMIVAFCGGKVCAQYMKTSIYNVYSCMRTSDNLEKSISSFYGELLRIKQIIQGTHKEGQVFFLLDEIFKGTNSYDRHTGAKVLIGQLYEQGAIGLVSTHDLELGDLQKESKGRVRNYHFEEYYKNHKIYFDYKLKSGISTTRNALYLLEMIGVKMNTAKFHKSKS